MIVTFYSFKGGVGRSMALVNVGEILADRGYNVVLCDWDLEAPGLERYLLQTEDETGDGAGEYARLISSPGLTDLLADYKQRLAMAAPDNPTADQHHVLLGNIPVRRPSSYAQPVSMQRPRPGSLRLLSAGRRDGENEHKYAEFVTRFDWEDFYNRWAGGSYIELLRQDLVGVREQRGSCDILLVDSRTGVTEQSGICTHHLADLVVLMSAANRANLNGIEWMASSLETDQLKALRGDRPIDVLPVRARVDDGAQLYELTEFRSEFMAAMRQHFPSSVPHMEALALKLEIPYRALYSFKERAVAREPIQKREQKLYDAYSALADAIVTVGMARGLLPAKNDQYLELAVVAPRIISPAERPRLALLSASPSEEPVGRAIAGEMRELGLNVAVTFDRSAPEWLRDVSTADRFLAILDPQEPPEEHYRLAAMLRRQALDMEKRVIPLMRRSAGRSPYAGQSISLPNSFQRNDPFFSALAEEIVASDGARLRSFGDVSHPYPGRKAYSAADALYFFGRDAELQELVSTIGTHQAWICLGGPSGVGRTSFIHAALLPAIQAGMVATIPANARIISWNVAGGDAPKIDDLLASTDDRGTIIVVAEDFERILLSHSDTGIIASALATVEQMLKSPRRFLLISSLSRLLQPRFDQLKLVNDFRAKLLRYDIDELSAADVRAIITGPVHLAGRQFERGLVERLLEKLGAWSNAPMFINVAMKRLWDGTAGTVLTHKSLDDLGGVNALIAACAEEATASLASASISWSVVEESLMTVVTAEGAPRQTPIPSAARIAGSEETVYSVAQSRLIRLDEHVEIANPQLAAAWPRLAESVNRQRERLAARDAVDAIANDPRTVTLLLPIGPGRRRLERLVHTAGSLLHPRFQRAVWMAKILEYLLAAIVLAPILWNVIPPFLERRAMSNQSQADENKAAAFVRAASHSQDPVTRLLLAIRAGELSRNADVERTLAAAVRDAPALLAVRSEGVRDVTMNREGSRIFVVDNLAAVNVFEFATGKSVDRFGLEASSATALSPTGDMVAMASGRFLRVLDMASAETVFTRQATSPITAMRFAAAREDSRDGAGIGTSGNLFDPRLIVIGRVDGGIEVWDSSSFVYKIPPNGDTIADVAFSADHKQIVVTSDTHEASFRVRVYTLDPDGTVNRTRLLRFPWLMTISATPFDRKGKRIAFVGPDQRVHIWSTFERVNGNVLTTSSPATVAAFDPTIPNRLIVGNVDGTIDLIELRGDTPTFFIRRILRGHRGALSKLRFVGTTLLSADRTGEVRAWDISETEYPQGVDRLLVSARQRIPAGLSEAQQNALVDTALKSK